MKQKLIGVLFFGLSIFLLFLAFYLFLLIPFSILSFLIGIYFFKNSLILLFERGSQKKGSEITGLKKQIEYLKKNGKKVEVDLSKCEIKENNYFKEEEPIVGSLDMRIQVLDAIYNDDSTEKRIEVNQTVLIFKQNYKGKEERFISSIIPMDKENLMFHLMEKKITTIYIDLVDTNNYYFDLEFLFPSG